MFLVLWEVSASAEGQWQSDGFNTATPYWTESVALEHETTLTL